MKFLSFKEEAIKSVAFYIWVVIILLTCCSLNSEGAGKKMIYCKIPENCNFEDLKSGYSANPCSPEIVVPTFEGLFINTPSRVPLSDAMAVKVACSFAFSLRRDLGVLERVENGIVFTVVDRETNIIYSGKMPNMDHSIPSPGRSQKTVKREELPDQIIESYVNLDLVKVLRIPKKTGRYTVSATISTFKSNVLEFEIYKPAQHR